MYKEREIHIYIYIYRERERERERDYSFKIQFYIDIVLPNCLPQDRVKVKRTLKNCLCDTKNYHIKTNGPMPKK